MNCDEKSIRRGESADRVRELTEILAAVSQAGTGQWDAAETALRTLNAPELFKIPDWLKPDAFLICSLKSYPDCRRVAKNGRLLPAEPRMCTWGMARNGWCVTQPVREEKGVGEGCSLSQILIPDAPERYFLSAKQMEKLLYRAKTDTSGMSVLPENVDGASENGGDFVREAA